MYTIFSSMPRRSRQQLISERLRAAEDLFPDLSTPLTPALVSYFRGESDSPTTFIPPRCPDCRDLLVPSTGGRLVHHLLTAEECLQMKLAFQRYAFGKLGVDIDRDPLARLAWEREQKRLEAESLVAEPAMVGAE